MQLLRHRLRHHRELLREWIPEHFISIICVMSAVVYTPAIVFVILGFQVAILAAQTLWVLGLIAMFLLTFTGKNRYDPIAHRAEEIDHQRHVLRRRNPDLRDVTDTYIDDIYHLQAVTHT